MRLNSFTDYCLRVLMYVGADPDERCTVDEIAAAFKVSRHHLVKVVQFLGRAGVLENIRGRDGGIELARDPAAINLSAIVRAAEGPDVPAECFRGDGGACRIVPSCRLRPVLADAVAAFNAVLDRHTLADLIDDRTARSELLALRDGPAGVATGPRD